MERRSPATSLHDAAGTPVQLLVTLTAMVTVFVIPPPVAVIVRRAAPTDAVEVLVRVKVLLPGAATVCELRLAVTPLGTPVTDNASVALNPAIGCAVRVTVAFPPGCSVTAVGLAERTKLGTFTVILVACVTPPPVAVMDTE